MLSTVDDPQLLKLPAGATGFGPSNRADAGDFRVFLTACHDAARRTDGTVTVIQRAAVTPDFDAVLLVYERERVAMLRHALLNLIAFVQVTDGHVRPPLAFTERPSLAQIFAENGFQVLSAAELRHPLAVSDLSELTAAEHKQIRYWKPATAGELLFNYWD
jgi:hypothetical protein